MRESFPQVASDNALNSLVDLHNALPGAGAQRHTDRKTKKHGGNQTKRKRPTKNIQALLDHIGTSGRPDLLGIASSSPESVSWTNWTHGR